MQIQRLKTPLNEVHRNLNGKMVDFAGWDMPVEYSGLRLEHTATREKAGLFDVSHMGEIKVDGKKSLDFLQNLLSNDISKCAIGQAQYNLMLNESGGVVDDLIVYRMGESEFLLVVNASNKDKDYKWIKDFSDSFEDVLVQDESSNWSQIAIQGPNAVKIAATLFPEVEQIKKFRFKKLKWNNLDWLVSRTGYTGEDGFEIYGPNQGAQILWSELLAKGQTEGLIPCGLGARNTLRIEAGLPLYGNELLASSMPLNIGMNWAIKVKKNYNFMGKEALVKSKGLEEGSSGLKLVGLISLEKAIPRDGYRVLSFDKTQIGTVTSGTYSPSLDQPIAMALVDKFYANDKCLIEVRKNLVEAKIVNLPFVEKK